MSATDIETASSDQTNDIPLAAPLRIGTVTLRARNLDNLSRYYQHVVGLHPIERDTNSIRLGTGNIPLLELIHDPAAAPHDPRGAGLFHTAFLLPNRNHLAVWAKHAVDNRFLITGASDHGVSEAIYLSDPEGNGIEIYADRPVSEWRQVDGQFEMITEPLDVSGLIRAGAGTWDGMPENGTVGHVHLKVGALDLAETYYSQVLGFDVACRYPGANFFGSGGYHHQIATNIWGSRGAGPRSDNAAGLAAFEIITDEALIEEIRERAQRAGAVVAGTGDGLTLRDPWNIEVKLKTG